MKDLARKLDMEREEMNIKIKMITSLEEQLIIKAKVEDRVKELERQIGEVCYVYLIITISVLFYHLLKISCVCALEKPLNFFKEAQTMILFVCVMSTLFTCLLLLIDFANYPILFHSLTQCS